MLKSSQFELFAITEKALSFFYHIQKLQTELPSRFSPDPISQAIVLSVNRHYRLDAWILATTCLRYSDVIKLDLFEWLTGSTQIIKQAKVKSEITIKPLLNLNRMEGMHLLKDVHQFFWSYNKLRRAIQQSIPRDLKPHLKKQNNATHIFRYLRASYLHSIGKEDKFVARLLGHSDDQSVSCYYIPKAIEIFQNNF